MKKIFLIAALFVLVGIISPLSTRAAADPTALTVSNRPYLRITEDGTVTILGARLMGTSKDYLGIQIFGINQNIMINGSTTLTIGRDITSLSPSSIGQSGEIDIYGTVDPATGVIMASNVRGVSIENDTLSLLQTKIHTLQIELLRLLKVQVQAGGK